jgi:hypothetical protein
MYLAWDSEYAGVLALPTGDAGAYVCSAENRLPVSAVIKFDFARLVPCT